MTDHVPARLKARFWRATLALGFVLLSGSLGYYFLAGRHYPLIDCVYMTVITITTIGYAEIIDLSGQPGARVFTMALAVAGIGTVTYLLSSFTAFIIEGELSERFRRRHMEKQATQLRDHFIVCGAGRVGVHVVQELRVTQRPFVVVDPCPDSLRQLRETFSDVICLQADATDNDTLLSAGIACAKGVFAATDHDHENLVIALSARQLNPQIAIVARCGELKNVDKMKAAGADAVISPSFIGGLRMASEMLRPTVVSFLDVMLRDRDRNLRIEEVPVATGGSTVADLRLDRFEDTLLLAIHGTKGWTYNPKPSQLVPDGSRLVVMTTPQERAQMEQEFGGQ